MRWIKSEPESPLFRASYGKPKILSDRALDRKDAFAIVQRRGKAAGIQTKIGCHTFRATGITAYLANGRALEHTQEMATHESPRTTKLYDRTRERLTVSTSFERG
jgi:integrase